jgi:hypothetical protein
MGALDEIPARWTPNGRCVRHNEQACASCLAYENGDLRALALRLAGRVEELEKAAKDLLYHAIAPSDDGGAFDDACRHVERLLSSPTCPRCRQPESEHPGGVYCPTPTAPREAASDDERCHAPGCKRHAWTVHYEAKRCVHCGVIRPIPYWEEPPTPTNFPTGKETPQKAENVPSGKAESTGAKCACGCDCGMKPMRGSRFCVGCVDEQATPTSEEVCPICDGGPGNSCSCTRPSSPKDGQR